MLLGSSLDGGKTRELPIDGVYVLCDVYTFSKHLSLHVSTTQLLPHLQSHSFPSSVGGLHTHPTTLVPHFLSQPKSNPTVNPSASTTKMCSDLIPSH